MNSTIFFLMAEFNAGEILLEDCCEKYFGLSPEVAKRRAMTQSLPVMVYKGTDSQKGKWLVSAPDLAEYLEGQKAKGRKLFNAMKPLQGAG